MEHFYQNLFGFFDFQKLYLNVLKNAPNNSKFVEVGSYYGKSTAYLAVEILNSKKNVKFYSVDIWKWDDSKRIFFQNMQPIFKSNLWFLPLEKESIEASKYFEDNSLHFVYIDSDHSFDKTYQELECWYPKVKNNGILAGHDYVNAHRGVILAVDKFVNNNNLNLKILDKSWLIDKSIS